MVKGGPSYSLPGPGEPAEVLSAVGPYWPSLNRTLASGAAHIDLGGGRGDTRVLFWGKWITAGAEMF